MALQTRNLRLQCQPIHRPQIQHQGLDTPEPGLHLRWQPSLSASFPWYGYHLYRRPHLGVKPSHLRDYFEGIESLSSEYDFGDGFGRVSANIDLRPFEDHFKLHNIENFEYRVPDGEIAVEISISLRFAHETTVEIHLANLDETFSIRRFRGQRGQTRVLRFKADDIRKVIIINAPVDLLDIETTLVWLSNLLTTVHADWTKITPTLCLPLSHDEYPCPLKPGSRHLAQQLVEDRIRYGQAQRWLDHFDDIYDTLSQLAEGGPDSQGYSRMLPAIGNVTDQSGGNAQALDLNPLQSLLMATLHPAMAQLLGLYWTDTELQNLPTTQPELSHYQGRYDYLLVADHNNILQSHSIGALMDERELVTGTGVDVSFAFDLKHAGEKRLPSPDSPEVYALPLVVTQDYQSPLSAGLYWQADESSVPGRSTSALYHVWYSKAKSRAPGLRQYQLLTEQTPIVLAEPDRGPEQRTRTILDHWPPVPLRFIHQNRKVGWHSYRISGMDIFGRHSRISDASRWFQRVPPSYPPPWYYQDDNAAGSETEITDETTGLSRATVDISSRTSYSVGLLDDRPPPAPISLVAQYLDPDDPYLERDEFYNSWLSNQSNSNAHGVRIQWSWPYQYLNLLPETRDFLQQGSSPLSFILHFNANEINGINGEILEVDTSNQFETRVLIGCQVALPSGLYRGSSLRAANRSFEVIAGNPVSSSDYSNDFNVLELRVENAGLDRTIIPEALSLCSIAFTQLSQGSISATTGRADIYGKNSLWTESQLGWELISEGVSYQVNQIDPENQSITLDRPYQGPTNTSLDYHLRHPFFDDFKQVSVWPEPRRSDPISGNIIEVHDSKNFSIKHEAVSDERDNLFEGQALTLATPGASTDNITHATLDSDANLSTLQGVDHYLWIEQDSAREDRLYRILSIDNNILSLDGEPNSSNRSHWQIVKPRRHYQLIIPLHEDTLAVSVIEPIAQAYIGVSAHIERRLRGFDSILDLDSLVAGPKKIIRVNRDLDIAPEIPPFSKDRIYSNPADYFSNSLYKLPCPEIPRGLSLQVYRCMDQALLSIDTSAIPRARINHLERFVPADWHQDGSPAQQAVRIEQAINEVKGFIDEPGASKRKRLVNHELSDDALRLLASLPDFSSCFIKLEAKPISNQALSNSFHHGYSDQLHGNSNARYFYRLSYIDRAHNAGPLSTASPPVYVPDLQKPPAVRWHKVLASADGIQLQWTNPVKPGTHYFYIFRSETAETPANVLTVLPGPRRVTTDAQGNAIIDLGDLIELADDNETAAIEAIYRANDFSVELLAQPAQTLSLNGPVITDVTWPAGTRVVVIYRDKSLRQQHTPIEGQPVAWLDHQATPGTRYYFRVLSTRIEATQFGPLEVYSEPSAWQPGKVLSRAPNPPTWAELHWVAQSPEGDITEIETTEIPVGNIAISLSWHWPADIENIRLQRRAFNESYWKNASPWIHKGVDSDYLASWVDTNVRSDDGYHYRIRCETAQGVFNTGFNEESIEPFVITNG